MTPSILPLSTDWVHVIFNGDWWHAIQGPYIADGSSDR